MESLCAAEDVWGCAEEPFEAQAAPLAEEEETAGDPVARGAFWPVT